jgi:hypothetical protein
MLMARCDARPVIPVEEVRKDFFGALALPTFLRKLTNGEIPLPVVRLDHSQKGPKGIPITDLAAYLDARMEAARRESKKLAQ